MKKWPTTIKSFRDAFNGLKESFLTQVNFRIHIVAAVIAILMGIWLHISVIEWAVLILTISMVIVCEQMNTAIEYLVDFISPEYHIMAGKIKDLAAGAVLFTAVAAIATGIFIFIPKLMALIQ